MYQRPANTPRTHAIKNTILRVPSTSADLLRCGMQTSSSLGAKWLGYIWSSNVDLTRTGSVDNPHGSDIVIVQYMIAKDGEDKEDEDAGIANGDTEFQPINI